MMRVNWLSRALLSVLRDRPINARLRLIPRVAGCAVALLVALSVAAGMIFSTRLNTLQHQGTVASRDLELLGRSLQDAHRALPNLARADSAADSFHRVARDTGAGAMASAMRSADIRFTRWYGDARRAAQGLAMSDDSETASPASLDASYRSLVAELDAKRAEGEREFRESVMATGALYLRLTVLVAAVGAVLLVLLLVTAWAATRSVDESLDASAAQLDAFTRGEFTVPNDTMEEGPHARLLAAQRRLGRLMRGHADVATALASGAFRRALPARTPDDAIGRSLALVAASMEDLTATAQRIARGDFSAAVEPRGAEDAVGHAHAAMARRIAEVVLEIEQTREMMTATAQQLRDDAATLTSLTADDAERMRRTADRLGYTLLQASSNAERAAALQARAEDSAAAVHIGATSLLHSFDDLNEMFRRSADVQTLAREAALLAVRSATVTPAAVEEVEADARALAERAATASSTLTVLAARGANGIYESGVLIDRVDLSLQQDQAVVREIGATTRAQASELRTIDESMSVVHRTAVHSATTARQLSLRVESLTAQTRRLESLMRSFRKRVPLGATPLSARYQQPAAGQLA